MELGDIEHVEFCNLVANSLEMLIWLKEFGKEEDWRWEVGSGK